MDINERAVAFAKTHSRACKCRMPQSSLNRATPDEAFYWNLCDGLYAEVYQGVIQWVRTHNMCTKIRSAPHEPTSSDCQEALMIMNVMLIRAYNSQVFVGGEPNGITRAFNSLDPIDRVIIMAIHNDFAADVANVLMQRVLGVIADDIRQYLIASDHQPYYTAVTPEFVDNHVAILVEIVSEARKISGLNRSCADRLALTKWAAPLYRNGRLLA